MRILSHRGLHVGLAPKKGDQVLERWLPGRDCPSHKRVNLSLNSQLPQEEKKARHGNMHVCNPRAVVGRDRVTGVC